MYKMIKIKASLEERMEEYEDLLCKRDQLHKEAASLEISYVREFGEEITRNFELKIECIKHKKMIAFCQKQINRGQTIDTDLMNEFIEREMALYYAELEELRSKNHMAKLSRSVDEFRAERAKKQYRKLAKLLHPDINRKTGENPKLMEIWNRIVQAYKHSDVDELDDLEILVRKIMKDMGDEAFEFNCDDLEARIERVEHQINEIITTEPYLYREILEDEDKIAQKHEKLLAEHTEYQNYLEELKEALDKVIRSGGVSMIWKMN